MPKRGTLSVRKAKELLNFKPKFSIEVGYKNISTGIKIFGIKLMKKPIKKKFEKPILLLKLVIIMKEV